MKLNTFAHKIRNIQQSVQYRDVIKQAPDVVVYIDGKNYIVNPYLGTAGLTPPDRYTGQAGQIVPFNDFTTSWQSSYDMEGTIPNGTLTLTVPTSSSSLFRVPGGNYVLKPMTDIRVFAKGFYFSEHGNTVYHQIFKGYIGSVSYVPSGMTLTITLNCFGALGILEKMQIDMHPGIVTSSPMLPTQLTSLNFNMDPYMMMAYIFIYSSMVDGFSMQSLFQASMNAPGEALNQYNASMNSVSNPYFQAVTEGYAAKWQALLYDLAKDTHLFGVPRTQDVIASIRDMVIKVNSAQNPLDRDVYAVANAKVFNLTRSKMIANQGAFYSQLCRYAPDTGLSPIEPLNGRLTSRLERLRYICNLVGYEMYQDVDGSVVTKVPLYNLDVLNLNNQGADNSTIDPSLAWISNEKNPFIVQESEIINEAETEDEAAVRFTRVTARGSVDPTWQAVPADDWLPIAEDIDFSKLVQFGLRTEPAHLCNWFQAGDGTAIFAYAASELAKANRGYRHYTITIPLRPEIKLAFPMYIPHLDIYGYIKAVTMNWTRGSNATTSVTLDSLRGRPMFPVAQTVTDQNGKTFKASLMTTHPDLVWKWTSAESTNLSESDIWRMTTLPIPNVPQMGDLVTDQDMQVMAARQHSSASYSMNHDSKSHCWRVQPDTENVYSLNGNPNPRSLDESYYADMRRCRPYTDDSGYELVGPFPWGRWQSLKSCLTIFTIKNPVFNNLADNAPISIQPVSADTSLQANAAAFLFSADSSEVANSPAATMSNVLNGERDLVTSNKVFELAYTSNPTTASGMPSTLTSSDPIEVTTAPMNETIPSIVGSLSTLPVQGFAPGSSSLAAPADQAANNRAKTMLSGQATSTPFIVSILKSIKSTFSSSGGGS